MTNKMKYALGEQDFRTLVKGGYVYIDKTSFINTILEEGGKYYFLARPRRFGKSLFLSTLQYFFEGERKLFKGLAVASTNWNWERYPVLRLDLNLGNYTDPDSLEAILEAYFREWEAKYDIIPFTKEISTRFRHIIEQAHRKTGKRVVVLVDEYDKPLVRNISREEEFEQYRAKLASLYSNFKSSSEHLRLVFLTGVSRFSKLSIFSDLNNLNDITFDDAFADICGVTVKEINTILSPGIEKLADKLGITVEQTERELKENYDGYRFTENGSHVYNPWSLLSCLYKGKIEYYWNDTGLPTLIAETLRRIDVNLEDTLDSYCGESDLKGLDLLNPNPTALLFQTGYLTIKDYDRRVRSYRLGLPNNEVKFGLFNVLIPYYVTTKPVEGNILVKEIARNFIFGEPEKGMKGLQSYFAGIDYAMRMDNENNFHNAFFLLMDMIGLNTATESHTSEGRIDIEIKTENYVYIIELKYDHPAEEALRQIQERNYGRKYQLDSRKLILIGASFSSKTRCIESWKILVVPQGILRMP